MQGVFSPQQLVIAITRIKNTQQKLKNFTQKNGKYITVSQVPQVAKQI